jgi:hypothetical protein
LSPEARKFIDGWESMMLNSPCEQMAADASTSAPRLYMDPILESSRTEYKTNIAALSKVGLINFTTNHRHSVTAFCVRKKGGLLRLIVDARDVNRRCRLPPGVSLASPECFAGLECTDEEEYFIATLDVRDAFHRLRLPRELSEMFCFPGGYAHEFNVSEIDGVPVERDTWIWPACACLPMGFSWSVFFAQDASCTRATESGAVDSSQILSDSGPDKLLSDRTRYFIYIDNIGIIGKDKTKVNETLYSIQSSLESVGLLTHDVVEACHEQDILGVSMDGLRLRTRASTARYCRVRHVLRWLLRQRKIS